MGMLGDRHGLHHHRCGDMSSGPRTETPLPTSMSCASWRTKPQHNDCPGRVRATSRPGAPLLPCGCEECKDKPNHRPDWVMAS